MHDRELEIYIDPSINPGYLDASYHYPPADAKLHSADEAILKLRVPGDGNCGFYSIALGLMNLIVQDKLSLSDETYKRFLSFLKQEKVQHEIAQRIDYYSTGIPDGGKRVRLDKCISPLVEIFAALNDGQLDNFSQFKQYLTNRRGYYEILALAIYLAPALRALSMSLLKHDYASMSHLDGIALIEAPEGEDGRATMFGQLNLLAGFFDFQLIGYDTEHRPIGASYGDPSIAFARSDSRPGTYPEKKARPSERLPSSSVAVDPLQGIPVRQRRPSQASLSVPAATPARIPEEVKRRGSTELTDAPLSPEAIISILFSPSGHWDFLLPLKDYRTPPYYFVFNFRAEGVIFQSEHLEEEQKPESPLLTTQTQLTGEKERFDRFNLEIIKLKIEVNQLTGTDFIEGNKLITILESNLKTLFTPKNASSDHQTAQHIAFENCTEAVRFTHTYFQQNTKRPSLLNILANLGLFLASLGAGYLLAAGVHYHQTGRFGFFHKPALSSELPAFSVKLAELRQERVTTDALAERVKSKAPETLPTYPEWSKIRI